MCGCKYWILSFVAVICGCRALAKVTTYQESCRYNNYIATYTLEEGPKSAVVIHFAEVTKYLNKTIRCTIKFESSRKYGYGVVGVLENIFMRRVKDDFHRWGESRCIDYVKEYSGGRSASGYDICGFRKRKHGYDSLDSFDYSHGIVGACLGVLGCDIIQTITLEIVIGDLKALQISDEAGSAIIEHADNVGFTLLVTAYKLPQSIENDRRCDENEFLCSSSWPAPVMNPFCIWNGFECDGHPNCGLSGALDEEHCMGPSIRFTGRNLEQMFVIVLFLLIVSCLTCVIVRWRRQLEGAMFFNPNSHMDIERAPACGGQEMACRSAQTISLLVLYQQNNHSVDPAPDDPPPYSSLFGRLPPSYSSLNFGPCPAPVVGRDEAGSLPPG